VAAYSLSAAAASESSLKPVLVTVDLAMIRKEVRAYVDSLQVPDKPYGCYRDKQDKVPSLYATCDVAIIRTIMGEDLRTTLTDKQRREWIDHINSFASQDGTYRGGRRQHSLEHANGMVVGALGPLGGKQKYPVRLYSSFDTVEKVGPWLEKIDWRNQWSGSHLFWGGVHCFSCSARSSQAWREAVFAWLDGHLDPNTGWWRRGVPQARPGIDGLGGGAHIWPIYQHHRHRSPYPERVIDSILAMQKPDGCWLQYTNYLELDALYGLAYMKSLASDYRKEDIARAVAKHGEGLTKVFPDFLRRDPDAHLLLGAVGAFGLLNQMMPQTYVDSVSWTDIFSDPRLYQTRAVEVLTAEKVGTPSLCRYPASGYGRSVIVCSRLTSYVVPRQAIFGSPNPRNTRNRADWARSSPSRG